MISANMMTIGELASKSRLSPRAIRYYEQRGLVEVPLRSDSNYRLYDRASLERLRFIAKCRSLGFSLSETAELLAITDSPNLTCAQVEALTRRHIERVDSKLTDLMEMKNALGDRLARCTGEESPDCPVIDFLRESA